MSWFPRNQYLWDFWFAVKGEELHVFYLQTSCLESGFDPERRHNLSSIGHAVLTRSGWQEIGTAMTKSKGESWDNLSLWTGCIIQEPTTKLYHLFYTVRREQDAPVWTPSEMQRPQNIGVAVSSDLLTWQRTPASLLAPMIPNPGVNCNFDGVAWRDPYVIQNDDGWFYTFICTRSNTQHEGGGAIAWVKSQDLNYWQDAQPTLLITSEDFYQMEVPQVFWRKSAAGKRLYLIFCAQAKDCSQKRRSQMPEAECQTGTYYLRSELLPLDFQGLPKLAEPARLLASGWYAGRLLKPETDEAPMFFGFQWADEAGHFVGGLSDPLRTEFASDGTIKLYE